MQINYQYYQQRRAFPLFWNSPDVSNSIAWQNIPALYAPYGTPTYWKVGSTPPPDPSSAWLAPNSGDRTSIIRNSFAPSGSEPAPAPTVAEAIITGAPVGPITLNSPMPSITPPAAAQVTVAPATEGSWASQNPLLAVGLAVGVYLMLKGGGR